MTNKKGKFIVIEGTDGCGKTVQTGLLKKYFEKKGYKIKADDYPRYETSVWGKLVGRMLMGDFGNPLEINSYLSVLPYMIDEYWGSLEIKKWVNEGRLVVSNRYFTANVHQVAKMKGKKKTEYRNWLWKTGWEEMKIYKPDLILILLLEPKISMKLVKKKEQRNYTKGKKTDVVEKSLAYQQGAFDEFKRMTRIDKLWVPIKCSDKKGNLLSPEKIHQRIIKVISDKLQL